MTASTRRPFPARRFVGIMLLAAAATMGAAIAQAQGTVTTTGPMRGDHEATGNGHRIDHFGRPVNRPGEDYPGKPVPEPGTMALAGMGLVTLGGAIRKRFTK